MAARKLTLTSVVIVAVAIVAVCVLPAGCGKGGQRSTNYFGFVEGNDWLYEATGQVGNLQVEMKVIKPDASLNLPPDVYDVSITGGLGNFNVSEQGLFLQVSANDVKLLGVQNQGAPPSFYSTPYIWLQNPLVVGADYNTAIQGSPTPALMTVTGVSTENTPWGPQQGFTLKEKSGGGPVAGVELGFVPYVGFTRINIPDTADLVLKTATLK